MSAAKSSYGQEFGRDQNNYCDGRIYSAGQRPSAMDSSEGYGARMREPRVKFVSRYARSARMEALEEQKSIGEEADTDQASGRSL